MNIHRLITSLITSTMHIYTTYCLRRLRYLNVAAMPVRLPRHTSVDAR